MHADVRSIILKPYHYHFYEMNILFLWRTNTGENDNERGMDRKKKSDSWF